MLLCTKTSEKTKQTLDFSTVEQADAIENYHHDHINIGDNGSSGLV